MASLGTRANSYLATHEENGHDLGGHSKHHPRQVKHVGWLLHKGGQVHHMAHEPEEKQLKVVQGMGARSEGTLGEFAGRRLEQDR